MRRSAKTAKAKAKSAPVRTSLKGDGSKVLDLERRLAEALKLKAEALEQLTATSEILGVISSSPTDVQPVMDTVAEYAARVCGATDSSVWRLEGEHLRLVARRGSRRRPIAMGESVRVSRGWVSGRAVIDRRTIHVEEHHGG